MAAVITSITGLQNLPNLRDFNADWNSLTTVNLSGLANLLYVDISDNYVLDASGDSSLTSVNLSGCTALEELRLDDSDFSAGIPSLAGLTSLTNLDLDQCLITGALDLSMLSALESFDLSNNTGLTSVTLPASNINDANLYGTALLPAVVNTILQQLDANGVINGYVSMEDGTSAAATGAGITAIYSLEAKGWQVYTNAPTTTTTTTTVAPNTFNVTNNGTGNYVIDGVANPTLSLVEGEVYTFVIAAVGHPFWIKTVSSTGTANQYNTGVTNNGTDSGTITFVVPVGAPATLYYNCQYHSAMAGTILITP